MIKKSKSKPIQPRNSNLNYIQFPDLKTKRKKTKNKNNNFAGYGYMDGGRFFSLPSPHFGPSLFTVLPRLWKDSWRERNLNDLIPK